MEAHDSSKTQTAGNPKQLVQQGYDKIAPRYFDWTSATTSPRETYLNKLLPLIPKNCSILELGCGAGLPITKLLVEHGFNATGNDISSAQVELAKKNVPGAKFIQSDMTRLKFEGGTFGAVIAFYSVIHLPREEQEGMLMLINGWLSEGGYLLLNLGTADNAGSVAQNWLGTESQMYWSGFDADTNREMVSQVGFSLVEAEVVEQEEDPGQLVSFLWILAKKVGQA